MAKIIKAKIEKLTYRAGISMRENNLKKDLKYDEIDNVKYLII